MPRPEDILNAGFAFIMLVLTVLRSSRIKLWWIHALVELSVIAVSFLVPRVLEKRRNGFWDHLSYWYVVAVVPVMFMNLKGLIEAVNPINCDLLLIEIDRFLFFGHDPTVVVEKVYHPLLTEILQIAYVSYFFIPIILGVKIYKKDKVLFRKTATTVLLTFYLSYLGYFLVPAIGPRFTLREYFNKPLKGILLTEPLKKLLNTLEPNPHDCFPSGHTAVSLVCLLLAKKYNTGFWTLLPMVTGLIISTVYHRYHYVVDVIAGVMLAVFCFFFGERFFELWEKRRSRKTL